jgi:hypothetical protein
LDWRHSRHSPPTPLSNAAADARVAFAAAIRLFPAGALLVAFAAARGRKQLSGWEAWLAIAAFGLINAACFQMHNHGLLPGVPFLWIMTCPIAELLSPFHFFLKKSLGSSTVS